MYRTPKVLVALAAAVTVVGIVFVTVAFTSNSTGQLAPPPAVVPTWHPIVGPSSVPQPAVPEKKNKVVQASAPVRLEIPSLVFKDGKSFDSSTLAGPGTSNSIQQWTKAMNDAYNGQVTPAGHYESSIVWDSTVAGGGLFGTDAQSNGRLLAHTTPRDWSPLGAFNPLDQVHIGDIVAITTQKGRLCFKATKNESVPKDQLNVVYNKEVVIAGVVYLITCDRTPDNPHGPTKDNLVVTLQLNQQLTNTGSC